MPRRGNGEPDGDGGSGGEGSVKEMQLGIEVALKKVAKTMLVMVALTMMKFRDLYIELATCCISSRFIVGSIQSDLQSKFRGDVERNNDLLI